MEGGAQNFSPRPPERGHLSCYAAKNKNFFASCPGEPAARPSQSPGWSRLALAASVAKYAQATVLSEPRPATSSISYPGSSGLSVERNASVAVATCFMAAAIVGAFCLKLSAVVPLDAACNSANAVLTCCAFGWRADESEASACRVGFDVGDRGGQCLNAVVGWPHLGERLQGRRSSMRIGARAIALRCGCHRLFDLTASFQAGKVYLGCPSPTAQCR